MPGPRPRAHVPALSLALLALATATAEAERKPPPDLWRHHRGLTLEAGAGIGAFRGSTRMLVLMGSKQGLAGPALGAGWFVDRRVAVGARVFTTVHRNGTTREFLTEGFAGPTAQVWLAPYAWLGAGAGLGFARDPNLAFGFGYDGRAGLTFNFQSRHTLNASFEVSQAFVGGQIYTGLGLLVGYQMM